MQLIFFLYAFYSYLYIILMLPSFMFQVSASDPDCGVNAMVNYTLGEGFKKLSEFEVKDVTGEVCIVGDLDYEKRSSYEFPIIATDRGKSHNACVINCIYIAFF